MKLHYKAITGLALAAGLVGAGGAAFAGTSYVGFDAIMPNLQQGWNSSTQTKAISNNAGSLAMSSVGSNYTANARICNGAGTCASERDGVGDNTTVSLAAGFPAGTNVHMQLFENPWALVQVEAIGSWKSN